MSLGHYKKPIRVGKDLGGSNRINASTKATKKRYVPDLYVLGCLVVELKAVTELAPEHEAQLFNYMRIARQPVGYLINFGHKDTLEWKRLILSELVEPTAADASDASIHEDSVAFG